MNSNDDATDDLFDLEDLYTDAQLHAQSKKRRKAADPSARDAFEKESKRMRELFALQDNWEPGQGVALVHAETHTLLGTFREYKHRSVKGCRKLVREPGPISVSATELVSGSWWLAERRMTVDASMHWTQEREAIVDVHLPELGVAFPVCEVRVGLYLGGIMRVELAKDTQFASPGGTVLLTLPQGTNVLECMSTDSKIALRRELGL